MEQFTVYRYSNSGEPKGVLRYTSAMHVEDVDGTDKLTLVCPTRPSKKDRLVWLDEGGRWREHFVDSTVRTHEGGAPSVQVTCSSALSELFGVQYACDPDLRGGEVGLLKGGVGPIMAKLLRGTRWTLGYCDDFGAVELEAWHKSVRECIAELAEMVGGEVLSWVEVGEYGVTSRHVAIKKRLGDKVAVRQFEWGHNMPGMRRTESSDEVYTACVGYGKKLLETEIEAHLDEVEEAYDLITTPETATQEERQAAADKRQELSARRGELNERLKAAREDPYVPRLEVRVFSRRGDEDYLARYGTPTDSGMGQTWLTYTDDDCEDESELREACKRVLARCDRPVITYEFDAIQLDHDGWRDIDLGDNVHIVDDELHVDTIERVTRIERDFLMRDKCRVVANGITTSVLANRMKAAERRSRRESGNSSKVSAMAGVRTRGDYRRKEADRFAVFLDGERMYTGGIVFTTEEE